MSEPDAFLSHLRDALRQFAADRDWEQFHTPKNIASALIVEAAELLEHFQWLTPEQSASLPPEQLQAVGEEIADVLIYLVRLADVLGIDPAAAARIKLQINARKYPVALSRGSNAKSATFQSPPDDNSAAPETESGED